MSEKKKDNGTIALEKIKAYEQRALDLLIVVGGLVLLVGVGYAGYCYGVNLENRRLYQRCLHQEQETYIQCDNIRG